MSFENLFSALYQIYYKADARAKLRSTGEAPLGLSPEELASLRAIDPARLERIVEIHYNDIWAGWYADRFGATWEALRLVLRAGSNGELVRRLCQSDAFEKRHNDDRHGTALQAFYTSERRRDPSAFENAPWLDELFRYESWLSQEVPAGDDDAFVARVAAFEWRVDGLLEAPRPWHKLPKLKSVAHPYWTLIGVCATYGTSEVEVVDRLMLGVLSKLLGGGLKKEEALIAKAPPKDVSRLEQEARNLLEEMRQG